MPWGERPSLAPGRVLMLGHIVVCVMRVQRQLIWRKVYVQVFLILCGIVVYYKAFAACERWYICCYGHIHLDLYSAAAMLCLARPALLAWKRRYICISAARHQPECHRKETADNPGRITNHAATHITQDRRCIPEEYRCSEARGKGYI